MTDGNSKKMLSNNETSLGDEDPGAPLAASDKLQGDNHSTQLAKERKQYANTGTEGSFEEWKKQTTVYNVSTTFQKNALEAMDMVQLENEKLKEENKQLHKQLILLKDRYHNLMEEVIQAKKLSRRCEKEKQDLQAEVGRQLFLESKEKRCIKIYQPPSEHASGMSMPGRVREKLAVPFHNSDELYRGESYSPQEGNEAEGASEILSDVDGKQSFVEERKEIFDNTEIDGEVQFCNSSNVPSFNSNSDFSGMGAKLLGGAGPLNNSGFLFQQRLQEISNSLSELELSRIKSLVRPLLDCLRLARIREGSELFEELERKGELSCSFVRDLLRRIHRFDLVEKLAVPFHSGDESYRGESYLSQEKNQQNEGSESVSGVDGKQADEVEEWNDIFDNTEADGEVQFSNSSNINPFNSDSEVAAVTFHAEIINESSFVDMDLSKERCDSASSLSQSFDVPSIGVVSEERSQSLSVTGEQFESGELKGACGAGNERGREGWYESSLLDGAEGQFNFNNHFNDIVDGAVNLPDRAQHSLMLEDFTGENQDSLPYGDTTQRQNVSGTRITVKKDRAVDQSDSHVSNESNKWEHLGARPRDRPPKIDRSSETSLLYSLENLVPPRVGGPVAQGVANAFLARHSEDKHLHESLYYTNAEEIFTENSSLPGASHVDGMKNLMDSNKANQNLGDCQSARRPDSYNQPHSSLFHQAGGVYIGGNNGLNTDFNLLNPIIANDFAPCTRMQDGTFPYLQRDELHSGFTGSGLTSDFMQTTGSQTGAFNTSNSNFSVNDYALGTKEPQIPPDGHFTSLQINQPPQPGFNGSGFSFDLTGTTGHEMTPSATVTHRNSDLSGSSSMLPSTTNLGLLGTSSVNMQTYDYRPDASPTVSSGARADVDGKQSFVEERKEIFDNTEIDGEVQFCNSSNVPSFNSNSEVAAVSFHAEIVDESSFVDVDLSKERCDSASTLSQSFDVPTFGEESQERSLSPSVADKEFESGELKGACVARDERDREGSYESSANDGAEGHVQFNFNDHFNGTVDGAVNLPDRGQESIMTVDFTIVNQDCLPFGDTIQRQCVTGAGIIAQKDTVTDQSDSHVGNQSNKWEHLGARPRDRLFPTVQRSPEPSLPYSSFLNLAPRQVAGPEAHGVASAFLERHSEDENLHKSLYYTNAQLLTENSSFQGASLVDSTINLTNSNQFRPYIGDAAFRPEPISQTQYSLLFPQTGGADRIRTPSMCEEEREIRTERGLQTTTLVVESLDSTHNSHRASEEGIKAAVARIQSRWPWFGRWCCTCANGLHNNQDVDAICTDCFKYKYCGPCRVRPQNGHDDRCIFLQDAFSGIQVLPFYRVYLQCLVWLIQRNIIRCPACGHNFFPQG